jgi:FkbM family methyltransferase
VNLSDIPAGTLIGRILRQPLKLIPGNTAMPILQGRLRGKRWIAGAHTHGCWLGSYESEKQKLFESKVRPGDTVFDIGANVGFYTLLASDLVGDAGYVYSFEPVPRNTGFLNEHLRLNRVGNVEVIEAAVSDRSGHTYFDDTPGSAMGHLAAKGRLKVRTVSIDALVSESKVLPPNCMKIDVEGGEFLVLSGAKSTLNDYQPIIFLATHGTQVHEQCCDLLKSVGYQLEGLGGASNAQCDELIAYAA